MVCPKSRLHAEFAAPCRCIQLQFLLILTFLTLIIFTVLAPDSRTILIPAAMLAFTIRPQKHSCLLVGVGVLACSALKLRALFTQFHQIHYIRFFYPVAYVIIGTLLLQEAYALPTEHLHKGEHTHRDTKHLHERQEEMPETKQSKLRKE